MPKKTFFNLPKAKKKAILEAMQKECARVPFDEVSINRIIKDADISRGSFYQYFEDKQDMLRYLLLDYQKILYGQAIDYLRKNNGDLFGMLENMLEVVSVMSANNNVCQQLFSDIRINTQLFEVETTEQHAERLINIVLPHVNKDSLDIRKPSDFHNMLSVLLAVTGKAFTEVSLQPERSDAVRRRFKESLALIQRGFQKG